MTEAYNFIFHICCQAAEFNVQAAQQGIVYIDEVDKITKKVLTFSVFFVLSFLYLNATLI